MLQSFGVVKQVMKYTCENKSDEKHKGCCEVSWCAVVRRNFASRNEKYNCWEQLGEWKMTVMVTANDLINALMEERQGLMKEVD